MCPSELLLDDPGGCQRKEFRGPDALSQGFNNLDVDAHLNQRAPVYFHDYKR